MKKILLIEDDSMMRENTAEILELANYEVFTAANGKEGSVLAKKTKPDLIVCDILMPELDGYGVLHVLSKDPETASIPFIFLTAKVERNEMRKGMELGADDYLTKPFEDTEILNAVEIRLKKNELIKMKFKQSLEGLNQFIDDARGIKELEDLTQQKGLVKYKKKQVIYHVDDMPLYLYFINKGKVKVFKTRDDGKQYVTDIFKPGDFFGLNPLLDNKPYSDSALVLEDSEIRKIPREDFLSLLYKNKVVARQFIKLLSNCVEEREKQLLSFAYDTIRKRTAEALVQLEKRFQEEGKINTCVKVTRDDLAGMAGTATETVIRCLKEFKEDNLIEVNGREIVILDLKGLSSFQY